MNVERETPREIARGGPRLARTCLLGPPSFSRDRMPAYLIRFLTRCIRGCLHPRACGCTLSQRAKVFVPCNEPPPCGTFLLLLYHLLRHLLLLSFFLRWYRELQRIVNVVGYRNKVEGYGRKGQTVVHIILLYGPRATGGGGRQA